MKKMSLMMCAVLVCTALAGCDEKEPLQGEPQTEIGTEQNTQAQEETEGTESVGKTEADELLDKFFAGEIEADGNDLYYEDSFYISDLPIDVEDWESYSIGERLDLDNDGENEQILYGPYGGMYLDAANGKVKVFVRGDGTALHLSYTYSEGEYWIVHSDTMHAGRKCYILEKYSGADEIVEKVSLSVHFEEGFATYYVDEQEVSKSVHKEEYEKYFGSETYFDYDEWVKEIEEIQAEKVANRKSLYEAFLNNEISVANPYVEGSVLSVMDDGDYEFTNAKKEYALLDVNGDGAEELISRMTEDYSNIMYILGVSGEELVAFDVYETHSKSMAHGVYTNGIVWWGQNYDGEEEVFYTYNYDGAKRELIHFVKENEMTDEENTYDYYYINGNAEEKVYLQSYDEYESAVSAYKGEWLEWNDLNSFTGL